MILYSDRLPNTYEFNDRVFADAGAFYDIGCYRWQWNAPFVGVKPIIGVDPLESTTPAGCVLVQAAVTPYGGTVTMHGAGLQAECCSPAIPYVKPQGYAEGRIENNDTGVYTVPAITWPDLLAAHGPAALVKINIEGAEIPLLFTAQQPMAPQLVVAFHERGHDYSQPNWPQREAITACVKYLSQWYTVRRTRLIHSDDDAWWHFTVKA